MSSTYKWLLWITVAFAFSIFIFIWVDITFNHSMITNWFRVTKEGVESGSTTFRNVGFVVAAVFALIIAGWRAETARRQSATAQQDLLNERYQKGAEMLGSSVLSVRLAGILALQNLADQNRHRYYVPVMQLLCAFIRYPTLDAGIKGDITYDDDGEPHYPPVRQDVQASLSILRDRDAELIEFEDEQEVELDLSSADLKGANLIGLNLSHAILNYAELDGADLREADLSHADLISAHACDAKFQGANLRDVDLISADISGATFRGRSPRNPRVSTAARGLTQRTLEWAYAEPRRHPVLRGVRDAETGRHLVWGRQHRLSLDE